MVWSILRLMGPTFLANAAVFTFSFGYLLLGYVYYAPDEDYAIDWTTSYCVMCLRLIGFGFDYYDGRKHDQNSEKASSSSSVRYIFIPAYN